MTDIEKVIKGLEHCMRESDNLYDDPCNGCPYYVEKQPSRICSGELQKDCYDLLKEQPQLVRCKDCKNQYRCEMSGGFKDDLNWFCADGEKR